MVYSSHVSAEIIHWLYTHCNCFPAATPLSIHSLVPLFTYNRVFVLPFRKQPSRPTLPDAPSPLVLMITHSHVYTRLYTYIILCNNREQKKRICERYVKKERTQDKGPFGNPNTSATSLRGITRAHIHTYPSVYNIYIYYPHTHTSTITFVLLSTTAENLIRPALRVFHAYTRAYNAQDFLMAH